MSLINFETELDRAGTYRLVKTIPVPQVSATVLELEEEVAPAKPSAQTGFLSRGTDGWDWRDLRDYVVSNIEQRFGVFPRSDVKESAIFKSFVARWGDKAGPIAKAVFEVHGGMWRGAPVQINRFTKNSDPFFAQVIADNMREPSEVSW